MTQFVVGSTGMTEAQFRQWLSTLYRPDPVTGMATQGIMLGLYVSQTTTASSQVRVSAGTAVLQTSLLSGAYPLRSDTLINVDVLGPNPMGALPRIDLVVFDSATIVAGSGGLRVVVGTPSATPSAPALPATAVLLATLNHAASATTVPTAKIDTVSGAATSLNGVTDPAVSGIITSNSASFAAGGLNILNSPSVTGDGVKRFKITAGWYGVSSSSANDVLLMQIKQSATALRSVRIFTTSADSAVMGGGEMSVIHTPGVGTLTYNLTGFRVAGTGTCYVYALPDSPTFIRVEHIR